jgi:hypothetical protein
MGGTAASGVTLGFMGGAKRRFGVWGVFVMVGSPPASHDARQGRFDPGLPIDWIAFALTRCGMHVGTFSIALAPVLEIAL